MFWSTSNFKSSTKLLTLTLIWQIWDFDLIRNHGRDMNKTTRLMPWLNPMKSLPLLHDFMEWAFKWFLGIDWLGYKGPYPFMRPSSKRGYKLLSIMSCAAETLSLKFSRRQVTWRQFMWCQGILQVQYCPFISRNIKGIMYVKSTLYPHKQR